MKKLDWLADFAESQKAQMAKSTGKKVVASKKAVAEIQNSDIIIMPKSRLAKAENGNTVKYKNCKWKVINASYRDAKGNGVLLKRIGGIDTKRVTDPEVRAYNKEVDFGGLDYNVSENSEVPKFNSEADATAQMIASEDARDFTTPDGRYLSQSAESVFNTVDNEPIDMEMGTSEQFGDEALEMDNTEDNAVDTEDVDMPTEDIDIEEDITDEDIPTVEEDSNEDEVDVEDTETEDTDVSADEDIEVSDEADDAFEDVDSEEEEIATTVKARKQITNRIIKAMLKA